jgi:alpha-galactosidase
VNIDFILPEEAIGEDLYYYYAAITTNDITSVFKHSLRPQNAMKDYFVAKNTALNANFNVGLVTAHRIFSMIKIIQNLVTVNFDMENRLIEKGNTVKLESFIYGTENENEFLEKRYASAIARLNQARPLPHVPTGWCSWSCYYRDVDDRKINNCVDDMTKLKGIDLFQIDDGWQVDGTFPGDWEIDPEKFPNGLDAIIKKCNDAGITFGLWLSPFLVAKDSVFFDRVKHLAKTDVIAGCSTPSKTYYPFDLDNPEYYELLYKTYHWLSHEMGVKYYKLDFLVFGYFSFTQEVKFKSEYRSALFRKVISTIRAAVGDDAIMLSCGSPIIECAGIFDAQRISRDIICPKSKGDPFYWQHWSNIKNASKTVLYRYFYNNVVFRNDPDGVVLRDYDIGDGFDCNYAEARYWSTIVAFSGGLVLTNDEFRNLSTPRKKLFTKLIPALGISGRANDMFEYPAPTKAIIEASDSTKYIANFNLSDDFKDVDINLEQYGIKGEKLIFKCWESEFIGKASTIHEDLVNPHSALMYMVKDIPEKPTFIYSNVNLYLGENVFKSEFVNGRLNISVIDDCKKYVTDETKIFAYYPIEYSRSITEAETVIIENENYIVTEYKL